MFGKTKNLSRGVGGRGNSMCW